MIDWRKDITKFLKNFAKDKDITKVMTAELIIQYYLTKGVKEDDSTNTWLIGIANQDYPPYTTAMKYIKEIRKENPLWRSQRNG